MFNFFFFLKTILMTVLLVAILQVRIGDQSLEMQATNFIRTSIVLEPVRQIAQAGAEMVRRGLGFVSREVSARGKKAWSWGENKVGERFQWTFERSKKAQEKGGQKVDQE